MYICLLLCYYVHVDLLECFSHEVCFILLDYPSSTFIKRASRLHTYNIHLYYGSYVII